MRDVCEPVFVVGMNGSGTSMMLDSLGRHPGLYAVPVETQMMPYIIQNGGRFGDLATDENFLAYWRFAIVQMPALMRITNGEWIEVPADWRAYPRTIGGIFDGIFSTLAAQAGKRRWCEKTPDHVQHLRTLAGIFPKAKFIHLIRDGREVACSIHRRQMRRPELIIYRWKQLVRLGQVEGARLGDRYTELRYEDLTSDPRTAMAGICRFLELDVCEDVTLSRMPQSPGKKRLRKGELGKISANPAKWPTYFDRGTVDRLERIGGAMLAKLGYESGNPAGDLTPGTMKLKFWRFTDFLRLTRAQRKAGGARHAWSKVARRIGFSVKQYRSKRY